MEKIYKICCAVMGVIMLVAFVITLIVGSTGNSPTEGKFGLVVVIVCLTVMAVMTVLALTLFKVGGRLPYKIGFYVLHAAIVFLIVGFIMTELATVTNRRIYKDENTGAEMTLDGDVYVVGKAYSSVKVGNKDLLAYGENFMVNSVNTEYYEDGMPKYYEAKIMTYNSSSGVAIEEKTLSVNHPQYIRGFKIYLMSLPNAGAAVLLIKYNPGEYVVLIGIACLVAGTFLSCFSGFPRKKKKEKDAVAAGKGGDAV